MGRAATYRKQSAKPFIVDVDARLLKKNTKLKLRRGARSLYGTCRALANGQTGALSINGCPLDWQYICRQAEISHCTWRKYRRELLAAGLLWEQRDRVHIVKDGRRRVVLGRTTYFVRRQAEMQEPVKDSTFLLGASSSTVEELAPQIIQKHLEPSPRGVGGCSSSVSLLEPQGTESSSPVEKADDDSLALLRAKAEETLSQTYDPEIVGIALDHILGRIVEHGEPIGSHRYIVKAFENLWAGREYNEVFDELQNRKRLREKFMPGFTGELSVASETQRQEFNRQVEMELLRETAKNGQRAKQGQAGGGTHGRGVRPSVAPKLSDHGITKDQSSDWQELAGHPWKSRRGIA